MTATPADALLRFFDYQHLTKPELRDVSAACHSLAYLMATNLKPSAELTTGLRKLLEAKDCFVRAALPVED